MRSGYPYVGCFGGRVWTCLIPKELAVLARTDRCLGRLFVRLTWQIISDKYMPVKNFLRFRRFKMAPAPHGRNFVRGLTGGDGADYRVWPKAVTVSSPFTRAVGGGVIEATES